MEGADLRSGSQGERWGRPRPGPRSSGPEGRKGAASQRKRKEQGGSEEAASRERSAPTDIPPRSTFGEGYGGVLGVDGVEDALVADLRLGDKADLATDIRGAPTHGAAAALGCSQRGRTHAAVQAPHVRSLRQ